MNSRQTPPSKICDLIEKWFDNKNLTQKRNNFSAFHNWDAIVGGDIAKHTEPVKFYNHALVIKVSNSVWTQELQYLKPKLLDKIRLSFPETDIRDIIFKVGQIKK